MLARQAVPLTHSVSSRLSHSLCYKQNERSNFHSPYTLPSSASCKSFSCNTYGSPRKCCKQKTYSSRKPFRCNTYKKQGERGRQSPSRSHARSRPLALAFSSPMYSIYPVSGGLVQPRAG